MEFVKLSIMKIKRATLQWATRVLTAILDDDGVDNLVIEDATHTLQTKLTELHESKSECVVKSCSKVHNMVERNR